jgi:putative endonuclease
MGGTRSARWFCYLLACADGTLYAGITTALGRRLDVHNAGAGSKYTRSRRPVRLVWAESCPDRATASRREAAIKGLSRARKLAMVAATSTVGAPAIAGRLASPSRRRRPALLPS